MTTLKCKKCSAYYPAEDSICPSCQYPSSSVSPGIKTVVKLSVLIVAAIGILVWFYSGNKQASVKADIGDAKVISSAFTAVKSRLKDPGSANFGRVVRHKVAAGENVACGTVNSKNSFGGYVGEKRFIYMYERQTVVFDEGASDFYAAWQSLCR
ncbi:hypothetical protein ACTXNJ_03740 [Pseudomonas helleri]|uniref:hypothetical protein n=1 Tax=Pseudomonas helleri TaxID=1608996 RepID=UPI0012F9968C|nr:hypothetical protein [Pseudomonas helleri]